MKKNSWVPYAMVVLLWIVYVFASINAPKPPVDLYHLTSQMTLLIQFSFFLPILFIWLAATYGSITLYRYAKLVRNTPDGAGMYMLSCGANLLVIHLFLSSLINSIRPYIVYGYNRLELLPSFTILSNLAYVGFYLVSFWFLFVGSKRLLSAYKNAKINMFGVIISLLVLFVLVYYYVQFIFSNASRTIELSQGLTASYYLPDMLIVLFIIIPSIVTWVLGVFTLNKLAILGHLVKGIFYKKAVFYLLFGLFSIIVSSVFTQMLTSLGITRLLQGGLGGILIIIYILLFILALGFLLIATGARKLIQIETV